MDVRKHVRERREEFVRHIVPKPINQDFATRIATPKYCVRKTVLDQLQHRRKFIGRIFHIRVLNHHDVTLNQRLRRPYRGAFAAILLMMDDQQIVGLREFLQCRFRPVT